MYGETAQLQEEPTLYKEENQYGRQYTNSSLDGYVI